MKKNLAFIFLLTALQLCRPAANAQSTSCSCAESLEFTIRQFEDNYAGFRDKTEGKQKEYLALTNAARQGANKATEKECYQLLESWIAFFREKHAGILVRGTPIQFPEKASPDTIRALVSNAIRADISRQEVEAYFRENKHQLHPAEGIWQERTLQYAVLRQPGTDDTFTGMIWKGDSLYWMPQHIRFELKIRPGNELSAIVYSRARMAYKFSAAIDKNIMILGNDDLRFEKIYPAVDRPHSLASYQPLLPNLRLAVRAIDSQTMYLGVPAFRFDYKQQLDSLLEAHRNELRSKPYLVIDLRNNGGGSDQLHRSILPLLYTRPIYHKTFQLWVSPANFHTQSDIALRFDGDNEKTRAYIEKIRKQVGGFTPLVIDTIRFNEVLPNPRKVAVLVNRNTGSSAEVFVLKARQSDKVVIMGENTTGVVDYGNMINETLPCHPQWQVYFPILRSGRLPDEKYDETGIAPDVFLKHQEGDWIELAKNYLQQKGQKEKK
ncbi:MAG TPA: S41 family peptidase [Flavisolibacter sp.]|jgi:hypothetical protein|nr:S41 family peptidase [Flavisolibacter sp.]